MNFGFVAPISSIRMGIKLGLTRITTSGVENLFFVDGISCSSEDCVIYI